MIQICDSLNAGGLERVAVNIANGLPRDMYQSYLCATRGEGALAAEVEPSVVRFDAGRRSRYDIGAVFRLATFVREQKIQVLHAHGTSLFFAVAAASLSPRSIVVWHDHFGRFSSEERSVWFYRLATMRAAGVIAVTRPLADWAIRKLSVAPERVWYVPNFAAPPRPGVRPAVVPGDSGYRIVCLANLRPEKDHENLLRALSLVVGKVPRAHLLLVGSSPAPGRLSELRTLSRSLGLEKHVSFLGSRDDTLAILASSDVGVLGSASEGLPLALLEYGASGISAVATDVGECGSVLAGGSGLVVPPRNPTALANALIGLLESPSERSRLAEQFHERYLEHYGPQAGIRRIMNVYNALMGPSARPVAA